MRGQRLADGRVCQGLQAGRRRLGWRGACRAASTPRAGSPPATSTSPPRPTAGQHAQRAQHRDQLPVIARPGVAGQRPLDHGRQRRRRALRVPERSSRRSVRSRSASPCIRRCGNTGPAAPAHPRPRAPAGDAWRTAARNPPAPAAPQRRYLALLQHAQQARLQGQRHVADLVQEQHAPMRLPQQLPWRRAPVKARLHSRRVRIRSGFQAAPRSSPPRTARRRAARMHLAREHFLARAGFALQQNGDAGIHQVHRSTQRVQRRRVQADGGWRGRDGAG